MLLSINKYIKCLRLKIMLSLVLSAVHQERMFDMKNLGNKRAVPVNWMPEGGECLFFIPSSVKNKVGWQNGSWRCSMWVRRVLWSELTIPARHSWVCSHFSWVRSTARLPHSLHRESATDCLQLACSMLASSLLLSLASDLGEGSWYVTWLDLWKYLQI